MPADILATRIDWVAVTRIVSDRLGKKYAASYCRDIARGMRNSAPVEPILRELGVMQDQIPSVAMADESVAA